MDAPAATPERFNPYTQFTGSWLPTWLLQRRELSPGAKLVYARLARYAGKRGVAFPRHATMAAEVGLSERQVRTYLGELRDARLIYSVQSGRGKPARYFFLTHVWITGQTRSSARQDAAGQKASARQDAAGQKSVAINDCARGLEESHTQKTVTAARGGVPSGRGSIFAERGNPRGQQRIAGMLNKLTSRMTVNGGGK